VSATTESFWAGRRVLVTGHTGFKGAWLTAWLVRLGANVSGYALAPEPPASIGGPSLFDALGLAGRIAHTIGDVRELEPFARVVRERAPEVVLHLAAQPLVRRSYREPLATLATNVMGTANLLEACRGIDGLRAIVVITTDKVYENREHVWAYREPEPLGGHDPYSASKACAELVTSTYRASFLREAGVGVATARAGNVIGGGDWSEDRLIPDLVRGIAAGRTTAIRNPRAVRPWQHVIDPLAGYLRLAEQLANEPVRFAEAWNFGPPAEERVEVGAVVERFVAAMGRGHVTFGEVDRNAPHEASELRLDSAKARLLLPWTPRLPLDEAVQWTARAYRAALDETGSIAAVVDEQLEAYAQR